MAKIKTCFIISPIGDREKGTWAHWDKVKRHLIEEVTNEKGYKTIRADEISKPGIITSQIIDYLLKAELVIADLSEKNANVFYELAIRDAARLPVILIGDKSLEIPFDVRQQRMIKYSLDPDDLKGACEELENYIDSVEDDSYIVDSPVTEAILKPSDEISATSGEYLRLILDKVSNLGTEIRQSVRIRQPSIIDYTRLPILLISPNKGTHGTPVKITGNSGFPYSKIKIDFTAPGTYIWNVVTDSSGEFDIDWEIPKVAKGMYDFNLNIFSGVGTITISVSFEVI